jgi:hypothetical protein
LVFASLVLAAASPASASVTIGQLDPTPSASCQGTIFDHVQPTVTSGNTYVVPSIPGASALIISSWSHNATVGAGQMLTMKAFRPLGGATYAVVGHDGPRLLTPSALNTFPASVPVKPGDVLGLHTPQLTPGTACIYVVGGGETHPIRNGNLADGESGLFTTAANRLNISAVVSPSNLFTFGTVKRNKKKGTATLTVSVPNPGQLALAGTGLKARNAVAAAAGDLQLKIKATGKKRRKLNETGKVKVKPKVTFTPAGGDPKQQSLSVKLKLL